MKSELFQKLKRSCEQARSAAPEKLKRTVFRRLEYKDHCPNDPKPVFFLIEESKRLFRFGGRLLAKGNTKGAAQIAATAESLVVSACWLRVKMSGELDRLQHADKKSKSKTPKRK